MFTGIFPRNTTSFLLTSWYRFDTFCSSVGFIIRLSGGIIDSFYHWSATREIMEIIRRRNQSPETRRLVELRNNLSRPGTLRRNDPHIQRTIFAPTRPTKRSREEIAEIDAELLQRTNRLRGGYQQLAEEIEEPENREAGEVEPEQPETEEDSVILRGELANSGLKQIQH